MKSIGLCITLLMVIACAMFVAATGAPYWGKYTASDGTGDSVTSRAGFWKATTTANFPNDPNPADSGSTTVTFDQPTLQNCAKGDDRSTFQHSIPCPFDTSVSNSQLKACCQEVIAAEAFMIAACIVSAAAVLFALIGSLNSAGGCSTGLCGFFCFLSFAFGVIGFALGTDWILNRSTSSATSNNGLNGSLTIDASAALAIVGWVFSLGATVASSSF